MSTRYARITTALRIIRDLVDAPRTVGGLAQRHGISRRGMYRLLDAIGAEIQIARRRDGKYVLVSIDLQNARRSMGLLSRAPNVVYMRERKQKLRTAGICVNCARRRRVTASHCRECADKRRAYERRKRGRGGTSVRCSLCGERGHNKRGCRIDRRD